MASQLNDRPRSNLDCAAGLANPRCRLGIGPNVDPFALPLHAALAEKEPALIAGRTKSALAAAKSKGVKLGNPNIDAARGQGVAARGNVATTRSESERRASGIDLEQWLSLSEYPGLCSPRYAPTAEMQYITIVEFAIVHSVVCVVSERVPADYLATLREKGISCVVVGESSVDLAEAVDQLGEHSGIRTLLLEGGGRINGAFLQADLVDEVSLLVVSGIDGRRDIPTVFDGVNPTRYREVVAPAEAERYWIIHPPLMADSILPLSTAI